MVMSVTLRWFHLLRASPLCTARVRAVQLHLQASRVSGLWLHLPLCFHSLRALLGLRASALLSHLNPSRRRLAEMRGLTRHSSVRMRTISTTSKNLLRGKSSQGEVSISPNFNTFALRGCSDGWDGCP
ncbi:hypothetical protein AAG906_014818 [Vitis piasezkii]